MSEEYDDDFIDSNLFEEPEEFLPPPPESSVIEFRRDLNDQVVKIRLIGQSPLYGHILTHGSRYLANYLDSHSDEYIHRKTILEVGAGGALPSIICGLNDALKVVITDYPDNDLIENIQYNIENNGRCSQNCVSKGYIWGHDTSDLRKELKSVDRSSFDLIILCDVIFNHTEQRKLLSTCKSLLTPKTGKIVVIFTPHRPHLLEADLKFFEIAQEEQYGFSVDFKEMVKRPPLFLNDRDESTREIRSRVYFYTLTPTW